LRYTAIVTPIDSSRINRYHFFVTTALHHYGDYQMAYLGGYQCKCDQCGDHFENKRYTTGATYCSTRCRVAAHRAKEKLEQRIRDFQREAAALVGLWKSEGDQHGLKLALERAAKTINDWNNDPTPNVKPLAISGRDPFIFDIIIG
jgi:hypothetical protein